MVGWGWRGRFVRKINYFILKKKSSKMDVKVDEKVLICDRVNSKINRIVSRLSQSLLYIQFDLSREER